MKDETAGLPEEDEEKSWRARLSAVADASRSLGRTRLAIFREEFSGKAAFAARGLAGVALAGALGVGALLLIAALIAALFAKLFGSAVLGILAALVLYAALCAAAAWYGWKALSRVRPGEFPATAEELSRDWEAIRSSVAPEAEPEGDLPPEGEPPDEEAVEDLEQRLRGGGE
jgi:membrane protein implicated in regulation of membrane protease activity